MFSQESTGTLYPNWLRDVTATVIGGEGHDKHDMHFVEKKLLLFQISV